MINLVFYVKSPAVKRGSFCFFSFSLLCFDVSKLRNNEMTRLRNNDELQSRRGLLVQQIAFGLDGGLTAGTCCADGLTVGGVSTVACHEDAGQLGAWGAVNLLQIANFVSVQPFLEDVGVGLVADGQEEAVNLDVYQLFVRFALALDSMTRCCITLEARRKGLRTMRYTFLASPDR